MPATLKKLPETQLSKKGTYGRSVASGAAFTLLIVNVSGMV
jgi:hypothetical protein